MKFNFGTIQRQESERHQFLENVGLGYVNEASKILGVSSRQQIIESCKEFQLSWLNDSAFKEKYKSLVDRYTYLLQISEIEAETIVVIYFKNEFYAFIRSRFPFTFADLTDSEKISIYRKCRSTGGFSDLYRDFL